MAKISVLGSGRWGSLIAWYLHEIGHEILLWGKQDTYEIDLLLSTRSNGTISFTKDVKITSDIDLALESEYIIISINSQNLRSLLGDLCGDFYVSGGYSQKLSKKKIILCMKGIEEVSGKRLSQVVEDFLPKNRKVAIWVGPGHVKSLLKGVPTCMVIDSLDADFKRELIEVCSSRLIRCYFGNDLIGNEIGAAAKNVIGIGAGMLDALDMCALKGALMARGTLEVSRLITAMGGDFRTAYGLCHLGDYEATLFSQESNNRKFGELLILGGEYKFVAEGVGTSAAINNISCKLSISLPIFVEIFKIINKISDPEKSIEFLFSRELGAEW
ncbi:MAG: NAD(P)H-dependent glycerol-3-phosphate dehydrogenase [Candidatus Improbicoccus devescovinae]|nr:MAG: NAD(P)H-dependent glycerol-3-phosphate dehydrogenase [Candidatus Improbicoccus devescovinae]